MRLGSEAMGGLSCIEGAAGIHRAPADRRCLGQATSEVAHVEALLSFASPLEQCWPDGLNARLELVVGQTEVCVKKLLELLVCIVHPVAVVLIWVNLPARADLTTGAKWAWAIFSLVPVVPFLYVLTGGALW